MQIKIEIGVLNPEGVTVWPAEFRTYAPPRQSTEALSHVLALALASHETVTALRTSRIRR